MFKKNTDWWLSHPSEKYEFVSWDDYSQYMEKKTCSKPPISILKRLKENFPKSHGSNDGLTA